MTPQPLKNPGVAALLSFLIPGIGQMYNSEISKGVIFFLAGWIVFIPVVGWIVRLGLSIWAAIDAHKVALAWNEQQAG